MTSLADRTVIVATLDGPSGSAGSLEAKQTGAQQRAIALTPESALLYGPPAPSCPQTGEAASAQSSGLGWRHTGGRSARGIGNGVRCAGTVANRAALPAPKKEPRFRGLGDSRGQWPHSGRSFEQWPACCSSGLGSTACKRRRRKKTPSVSCRSRQAHGLHCAGSEAAVAVKRALCSVLALADIQRLKAVNRHAQLLVVAQWLRAVFAANAVRAPRSCFELV